MAQKTVSVRFTTKDSEVVKRALNDLGAQGQKALQRLEDATNGPSKGLKAIDAASRAVQDQFRQMARQAAGAFAVREVVRAVDGYGLLQAKIKLTTETAAEYEFAQKRLYELAQRNRNSLDATVTLYTRLATSSRELGRSQSDMLQVVDTLQKAIRIGGSTSVEAAAGVIQLSQALASGRLQGDEFRSVMENMTRVAQAIAKGMGVTVEQLRELSKQGKLTSQQVVDALLSQGEAIRNEFGTLPKTVAESFTQLTNSLQRAGGEFGPLNALIRGAGVYLTTLAEQVDYLTGAYQRLFGLLQGFSDRDLVALVGEKTLESKELERFIAQAEAQAASGPYGGPGAGPAREKLDQVRAEIAKAQAELDRRAAAFRNSLETPPKPPGGGGAGGDGSGAGGSAAGKARTRDYEDYLDAQQRELDQVRRLADAQSRSAQEYERVKGLIEAENEVLQVKNALARGETRLTEEQEARLMDLARARAAEQRALDAAVESQRRAEQERRRAIEKAREDAERPFIQAGERIQDAFADAFENIFSGGVDSFSDLGDAIRKIMLRTAAEVAAAMVFRPVIGGVLGGIVPGLGAVAGGGGGAGGGYQAPSSSGVGAIASNLGGLSSAYNFLTGASGANLGGLFAKASMSSGIGSPTTAQLLGQYFTPAAGLAGFGGNYLANALFGQRGIGATVGGTLGGIGGTVLGGLAGAGAFGTTLGTLLGSWGGPVGALAGSFLGNAVGGLFGGGGVKHPAASFEGYTDASGALGGLSYLSKHMGTEGVQSMAEQVGAMLQLVSAFSGASLAGRQLIGVLTQSGGSRLSLDGRDYAFDRGDESSYAEALRRLSYDAAKSAGVLDGPLVDALEAVRTQGRTAAEVIQAVADRLEYVAGLQAFKDQLNLDPNLSTADPEAIFRSVRDAAASTYDKAFQGDATARAQVQQASTDYLNAAIGYYGRGTPGYDEANRTVQAYLDLLIGLAPRGYADGGVASGTVLVGERGPELLTLGRPSRVYSNDETRRMLRAAGGDDSLAREFRAYRSQSASETTQLREGLAALAAEFRTMGALLRRAASA
ncbi:tape measure protein [Paludisphaera rhizosphaerae]|uniref:tape measure protein n=1 Tax=Paludisphaera rhizosphaerae TaxID=2711216 RepID=UPI0013EC24F0|nr:tape measure protein [Paludisphaera rhizosphaerae]